MPTGFEGRKRPADLISNALEIARVATDEDDQTVSFPAAREDNPADLAWQLSRSVAQHRDPDQSPVAHRDARTKRLPTAEDIDWQPSAVPMNTQPA